MPETRLHDRYLRLHDRPNPPYPAKGDQFPQLASRTICRTIDHPFLLKHDQARTPTFQTLTPNSPTKALINHPRDLNQWDFSQLAPLIPFGTTQAVHLCKEASLIRTQRVPRFEKPREWITPKVFRSPNPCSPMPLQSAITRATTSILQPTCSAELGFQVARQAVPWPEGPLPLHTVH